MFSANQGATADLLLGQEPFGVDQGWSFEDFIELDEDPQQHQMQLQQLQQQFSEQQFPQREVLPERLAPPLTCGIQRRRSSSMDTQAQTLSYPSLTYSPGSSIEENVSPAMVPYDTFFSDLNYLIPPSNEQDLWWQQMQQQMEQQQQQQQPFAKHRNFRRRSSSVPPTSHSALQFQHQQHQHQLQLQNKPIVFAQIRVADNRPPPPPPKPSMPVQIERLHRNPAPSPSAEEQRTAMNQRLLEMNFDDVTVAELKKLMRHYGHSTSGRKAELIERLQQEQYRLLQQNMPTPLL